jgi:hypothetical protein
MKNSKCYCPICYTELVVEDVTPCMECGNLAQEIEHTLAGKHTFAEMRIFDDLSLILCDFCQVDFGSFDPEYFGLEKGTNIGFHKMQFVRTVQPTIAKDKICPACDRRLSFLKFVDEARELHKKSKP